jgi:hypothetical protein
MPGPHDAGGRLLPADRDNKLRDVGEIVDEYGDVRDGCAATCSPDRSAFAASLNLSSLR